MLFSAAKGFKVVSKTSADTVGRVTDFVIDPQARKVVALVLKKTTGNGDTLPWVDLAAFGDDAVIIEDANVIVAASGDLVELSEKRHAAQGKRVLTTDGADVGKVDDIDFDPQTGDMISIVLKDGGIDASRLLAVGSYAVVVKSLPGG